jgi:hypothetical protein
MRISISRSSESLWIWLFWCIGIYLMLELVPFLVLGLALKKSANVLVGPYLALAVPCAIIAPLIWWLWKWKERGVDPKRLARGWGASMALFGVAMVLAVSWSGVKLGLMDPKDALGGLILSIILSVPIGYFTLYYMIITRMSSQGDEAEAAYLTDAICSENPPAPRR